MSGGTIYDVLIIESFAGGYDEETSPVSIGNNQIQSGLNCWLTPYGAIRKIPGYTKYITGTVSGMRKYLSVHRFYHGGTSVTVVAVDIMPNPKIYQVVGNTLTEITGGTDLTAGYKIYFTTYSNILYIYNGVQFQYWTGSGNKADVTFAAGSVSVVPKIMAAHNDRLWMVNASEANTIYWTEKNQSPTTMNIPAQNYVFIPERGEDLAGINALASWGLSGKLLVGRENDIWEVLGRNYTDIELYKVSSSRGMISTTGWCLDGNDNIIFVGNGQVYENGVPIGNPIKTTLGNGNWREATAVYSPKYDVVIIGYSDGSIIWNCTLRCWLPPSNLQIDTTCWFSAAADGNDIVFTRADSGYLYKMFDGNTFDGENIVFNFTTKTFTLGGAAGFVDPKFFRGIWLLVESGNTAACTATINIDRGRVIGDAAITTTAGSIYGTAVFGVSRYGGQDIQKSLGDPSDNLTGNMFQIMIEKTDEYDITIHKLGIEYTGVGRRRS